MDAESSTVEAVATTLKGILSGESGDETDRNGLMLRFVLMCEVCMCVNIPTVLLLT